MAAPILESILNDPSAPGTRQGQDDFDFNIYIHTQDNESKHSRITENLAYIHRYINNYTNIH